MVSATDLEHQDWWKDAKNKCEKHVYSNLSTCSYRFHLWVACQGESLWTSPHKCFTKKDSAMHYPSVKF